MANDKGKARCPIICCGTKFGSVSQIDIINFGGPDSEIFDFNGSKDLTFQYEVDPDFIPLEKN